MYMYNADVRLFFDSTALEDWALNLLQAAG